LKKFKGIYSLPSFLKLPNDEHFPEHIEEKLKYCTTPFNDLDFKKSNDSNK
jgi:hypothetical protein